MFEPLDGGEEEILSEDDEFNGDDDLIYDEQGQNSMQKIVAVVAVFLSV